MQIVIHGMYDIEIRTRVLSRNPNNELKILANILYYIAAEEAGKNESNDLHKEDASVGSLKSKYRRNRDQRDKKTNDEKCVGCGQASHNTIEDMKKYCKAWDKTCSNCNEKNHFTSVCNKAQRKKQPVVQSLSNLDNTVTENEDGHPAEVSGVTAFVNSLAQQAQSDGQPLISPTTIGGDDNTTGTIDEDDNTTGTIGRDDNNGMALKANIIQFQPQDIHVYLLYIPNFRILFFIMHF